MVNGTNLCFYVEAMISV